MSERLIERALISVFDKKYLVEFARELTASGVEILSTGGTAKTLLDNGVKAKEISSYTGFPELLDGRVKSLHPKVYAGLLFRRGNVDDERSIKEQEILPIDLVAVNLYPFEKIATETPSDHVRVMENIDIGGPALIRAAAKNHLNVAVLVDPEDYKPILEELKTRGGRISSETRLRLAEKAFRRTAEYDAAIRGYFESLLEKKGVAEAFPMRMVLGFEKIRNLRYGENPHQRAAVYREIGAETCIAQADIVSGKKELSYTNILDADFAFNLVREFEDQPTTVIVKHANPCGGAIGETLLESCRKALQTDPVSAFGGIYAFNREVDSETAHFLSSQFIEVIIAPGYTPEALEILSRKENRRILDSTELVKSIHSRGFTSRTYRSVLGGMLFQESDDVLIDEKRLSIPTKRKPTDKEMKALMFGWKFVKHVRSNAIVLASATQLIGVGAGQMSRVDSCKLAILKAQEAGLNTLGTALASDGFIPFRDTVDLAVKAGVTALIEPGGSMRDKEVIEAADHHGVAMVFTGIRHFRH
jgi:phosphoribosylaminoimidazolecarboxamide formyltransferase/IMP cyclohydrolase